MNQTEQLEAGRAVYDRIHYAAVMVEAGGNEWQKNGQHRVYFNGQVIAQLAEPDGPGERRLIRDLNKGHYWYEVRKQEFLYTGDRSVHCRRAWRRAVEVLESRIAEE